ncbi:hypothetical protein ACWC2K_26275 [Streptomyces chattanoogensis]
MSEDRQPADDEPSGWTEMSAGQRALAVLGITGLGLGVAAVVTLFLLLGILVITVVCGPLIESDGPSSLVWAAVLALPCGVLGSLFVCPVRLLAQVSGLSGPAKRVVSAVCSLATTFVAALLVADLTPGLHVTRSWIPALMATVLVAGVNIVLEWRANRGKRRGDGA